jgi:hypothetical protein
MAEERRDLFGLEDVAEDAQGRSHAGNRSHSVLLTRRIAAS